MIIGLDCRLFQVKELPKVCAMYCMDKCPEGIARKYYVFPGIGSVSLSPFSNIGLHHLPYRFVLLPLMKDGRAPTELEET
jgi:hypothetical protein